MHCVIARLCPIILTCIWLTADLPRAQAQPDPKDPDPCPECTPTPCVRCNPPPTPTPTPDPKNPCPSCTPGPTPEGPCYDPATHGCCSGNVYDLAAQGCCNGQVYNMDTQACCMGQNVYNTVSQKCCEDGSIIPIDSCCIAEEAAAQSLFDSTDKAAIANEAYSSLYTMLKEKQYDGAVVQVEKLLKIIDKADRSSTAALQIRSDAGRLRTLTLKINRFDLADRLAKGSGLVRMKKIPAKALTLPAPGPQIFEKGSK
jgi:hypothetical protein